MFKKILLGITGGIAAYKTVELVRLLRGNGAEVKIIMTKAARQLITPLTLRSVSNNMVYTEMFQLDPNSNLNTSIEHIDLARWAEVLLIAPATANIIAKIAHGIADDLLSTVSLATAAPIVVAPAMNHQMWDNAATQNNIQLLAKRNVHIFEPTVGMQACGEIGIGRMQEPQQLLTALSSLFAIAAVVNRSKHTGYVGSNCTSSSHTANNLSPFLSEYRIIITAGTTHEKIDNVRYLSNYSSGKMGYALAQAAHEVGAQVTLISGPTNLNLPAPTPAVVNDLVVDAHTCPPHNSIKVINVTTAQEMYDAVMSQFGATSTSNSCRDIFIAAAAVADYRPVQTLIQKLKRENQDKISLELERTPDILSAVAALPQPPFTIGFAAETENLLANATKKLQAKNIDMIVANKVGFDAVTQQPIGFNSDENEVVVLRKDKGGKDGAAMTPSSAAVGNPLSLPLAPKLELARKLIRIIYHEHHEHKVG